MAALQEEPAAGAPPDVAVPAKEPGAAVEDAPPINTEESLPKQSPPKASKPKQKKEKNKYPEIRKQLVEHYGLSVRDHFIRDCVSKFETDDLDLDNVFLEAINQTLTGIAEPYLSSVLNPKTKRIPNKSLLQIFSIRDIAKSQQKQDQLNTGDGAKRMLHFVLSDGKTKVSAIEYQHVALLDNVGIYPGTKLQLENVDVLDEILLLKPSNVAWIGGDVESFSSKYIAAVKSREGDTRVFQKNLLKNETPPPLFEANDLTRDPKEEKEYDEYEEYYDDNNYQDDRYYDDGGQNYDDTHYEAPPPPKQTQPKQAPKEKKPKPKPPQPQAVQPAQPQAHDPVPVQNTVHNVNQAAHVQQYQAPHMQQQTQYNQPYAPQYGAPQHQPYGHHPQQYNQAQYGHPAPPQQYNNYRQHPMTMMTLQQLYGVKQLPFTTNISAEIIGARLQFNNESQEPFIEFEVNDTTGKCKAMTSTHLMQWICSQYGQQINQQMVNTFFKQWGNRYINIKMELLDPNRMVIFHDIKWQ